MAIRAGSTRSLVGLWIVAVIAGVGRLARAEGPAVSLVWTAPADCPSRDSVLARAEQLAGRGLQGDGLTGERVQATVDQLTAEIWRLRLESVPSRGLDRTLSAPSCADLAEATALFLALSADVEVRPASGESPRSRDVPTAAVSPSSSPSPTPARSGQLGALAALEFGRLPGIALGVLVEGLLWRGRWLLVAPVAFFPSRHASVETSAGNGLGGNLWMGSIGLGVGRVVLDQPALTPFLKLDLALVHGEGANLARTDAANMALVALGAGVDAMYALSPAWSLAFRAEGYVLAKQPRFILDSGSEVYRPRPIGLQVGLGARFGGF